MGVRENGNLEQALSATGDGAFVIMGDGKIVLWNRAAEKILGYTAREVLGRACCELFVGRDDNGNRLCYKGCHVMSLVKLGDPIQNFDMETRTKTGHSVWLNISTIVTSNGASGPLTVHLFRNVTATKELLKRLEGRATEPHEAVETNGELTRRELEILRLLVAGENTKEVAERLHVSTATVRNHVQNIFAKLGVHSRLQAVAYATTHRLL